MSSKSKLVLPGNSVPDTAPRFCWGVGRVSGRCAPMEGRDAESWDAGSPAGWKPCSSLSPSRLPACSPPGPQSTGRLVWPSLPPRFPPSCPLLLSLTPSRPEFPSSAPSPGACPPRLAPSVSLLQSRECGADSYLPQGMPASVSPHVQMSSI